MDERHAATRGSYDDPVTATALQTEGFELQGALREHAPRRGAPIEPVPACAGPSAGGTSILARARLSGERRYCLRPLSTATLIERGFDSGRFGNSTRNTPSFDSARMCSVSTVDGSVNVLANAP